MKVIKEVIVVEGKHDSATLKQYFKCDTVITNGLSLDEKITNKIFSTNFLKSHLYPKSIKKEKMIEEIAKEKERVLYLKSLGLSSGDITRFEEMNTKIKEKIKR